MAITYVLGTQPRWLFTDRFGNPLGSGTMETYSNLDHTSTKAVYQTASNALAWTNPILFDENGMQGPFFFQFDDAQPDQGYFLVVKDADGNLIFTEDNYFGGGGGGGGGGGTTILDLENHLVNGSFWRNVGSLTITGQAVNAEIAPGAHEGFHEPDIRFIKNSTTATDTLTFNEFALGTVPFGSSITPVYYLNYTCTNTPAPETQKCVQFPIISNVRNLSNQTVTFKFWAQCTSGDNNVTINVYQYFGTGGVPSVSTPVGVASFALTGSWAQYEISFTVPDVGAKTEGTNGDSALYVQFQYPFNVATNINLAKPMFFIGDETPNSFFETFDAVNSVISAPRTGDVRMALNTQSPFGWVPMNDGTIGSPSSNATTRANLDTFYLYSLIWNTFNPGLGSTSPYVEIYSAFASPPVQPYSGNLTTFGASASADFAANKSLSLTRMLGRVLTGTAQGLPNTITFSTINGNTTVTRTTGTLDNIYNGMPCLITSVGSPGTQPFANITYYIKVLTANTFNLYFDPGLTSVVTPTASTVGTLRIPDHLIGEYLGLSYGSTGTTPIQTTGYPALITTGSAAASIRNPATYMNFFIKL